MKEALWKLILSLKEKLKEESQDIQFCHIDLSGEFAINRYLPPSSLPKVIIALYPFESIQKTKADTVFVLNGISKLKMLTCGGLDESTIHFLKLYLPYCFLPIFAKQQQRAISIAHFAQSLDGRVATCKGDSKWIGNQENLIHAHRMRALCDAILIGSGTLEKDEPRLTVRLVAGENPKRVILGTSVQKYASLYESSEEQITVIGRHPSSLNGQIDYVQLPAQGDIIHPALILKYLFEQGKYSVYVEGGSTTTSHFIQHEGIDILQLHLSPLLLGGGQSCVNLSGIEKVQHAIRFKNTQFQPFGDAVMFSGELV